MEPTVLRVLRSVDGVPPIGARVGVPAEGGVLGRAEGAGILVPSVTVSRRHARLTFADGWWVEALTAENGTFVDGRPVLPGAPERLGVGVPLQVGGVVLELLPSERTRPVFEALREPKASDRPALADPARDVRPEAPVLVARFDASACAVRCGDRLLPLEPQPARALATLVEHAGVTVHRWDLLDRLGPGANVDRCMSKVRRVLKDALLAGILPRVQVEAGIRAIRADAGHLADLDADALLRQFVASRRGHGYLLCLEPHRVAVEVE